MIYYSGTVLFIILYIVLSKFTSFKPRGGLLFIVSLFGIFLFLPEGSEYKSISLASFLYYYLLYLEEKKKIDELFFLLLLFLFSFLTVILGLNEIVFDKEGFLMFKINIVKCLISSMWLLFSVYLFKSINLLPSLVPTVILIISIFSYQVFSSYGFLSTNILFLMHLMIYLLLPLVYLTFPPEKINFTSSDAGILGYVFGIFLIYSVNYSIVFTSLMIPILMMILPVIFFLLVLVFSYGKYLVEGKRTKRQRVHFIWNINKRTFLFFIVIFTFYFNLLGYFYFMGKSDFFYLLGGMLILILYYTGRFLFLKEKENLVYEERVEILGVSIDNLTMEETLERIEKGLSNSTNRQIVTSNSIMLYQATRDTEFRKILQEAELVVPDGIGLFWASDFLEKPLKERVPGIDLMIKLLEFSSQKGYKVYFLGSREEILQKAVANIKKDYPELNLVGYHHGYFSAEEEDLILQELKEKSPDFLFVALGSPGQEKWIYKYKNDLNVRWAMGVGGSFDVLSGYLKRAPFFMQKMGLEWLYRLWQEPYRWRRILILPLFVKEIIRDRILKMS